MLKEDWRAVPLAELEQMEKDAKRYRWLCAQGYGCDPAPFRLLNEFDSDKQSIDSAIDAAMSVPNHHYPA